MHIRQAAVLVGLSLAVVFAGCSSDGASSGAGGGAADAALSKTDAKARAGKGDDGGDLCEEYGWYGDGECDTFCPEQDTADCGTDGGDDGAGGQDGVDDGAGGDGGVVDGGDGGGDAQAYFFTQCRFGSRWIRLDRIAVGGEETVSAEAPPSDAQAQQILAGLKAEWGGEGSPADMAEAYDATDDKEFLVTELTEEGEDEEGDSGGKWVAYRYYAGDTEVGFFFEVDGDEPVMSIGDGEIYDCIGGFEPSASGDSLEGGVPDRSHWVTWASLNSDLVDLHALEITDSRLLKDASDATEIEASQLVAGVHGSATVEEAFDNSDDGEFLLHTLTDAESGDEFTLYRYWAGDNPVGFVVAADGTEVKLEIGDGEIGDITVHFEPNPE